MITVFVADDDATDDDDEDEDKNEVEDEEEKLDGATPAPASLPPLLLLLPLAGVADGAAGEGVAGAAVFAPARAGVLAECRGGLRICPA